MHVCRYLSKAMETQPVLSADCAVNNSKGLFPHLRKAKDFHENERLKKNLNTLNQGTIILIAADTDFTFKRLKERQVYK